MNTSRMQVILGLASLKAYVTAPKTFQVLGIVRFGLEYGLLATNTQGMYFRVNGSQIAGLDAGSVERAIDHAYGQGKSQIHTAVAKGAIKAAPQVIVRKHRHPVKALAH